MLKGLIALLAGLVLVTLPVKADGFQWLVNCVETDASGRLHYWIGYESASDLPYSTPAYIGQTGFYMDTPNAGIHEHAVEVIIDDVSPTAWLALYPDDVSINIDSATPAPACDAITGHYSEPVTYDDKGAVNNADNPRGNTCYGAGQVCVTEKDWIQGWYRMHS